MKIHLHLFAIVGRNCGPFMDQQLNIIMNVKSNTQNYAMTALFGNMAESGWRWKLAAKFDMVYPIIPMNERLM